MLIQILELSNFYQATTVESGYLKVIGIKIKDFELS